MGPTFSAQADALPDAFRDRVGEADHVIHAGDFGSADAYADLAELADGLTAVYGNADPRDIDLPPVASARVGGVTFVVVHGIVNLVERAVSSSEAVVTDREDWLDAIADVGRAEGATMMTATAEGGNLDVTIHEP